MAYSVQFRTFFGKSKMQKAKFVAIRAALAGVALSAGAAHAALDATITTAISGAGADLTEAATAVVVAMIGAWAVRAVGKKMGWWA